VTVAAFVLGSTAAGAAAGALVGLVGAPLDDAASPGARVLILGAVVLLGAILDLEPFGTTLPTPRRQVSEEWLNRYRGWVYGIGFGVQLGVGVATIVTTSAVYATLAAAALSGSALAGTVVGGTFGLVRGLTVLPSRGVRTPGDLVAMDARLRSWSRQARLAASLAMSGAAALLLAVGLLGVG
jgi:hypothetical protein